MMKCGRSCTTDADMYYIAILGRPGETTYADGWTCFAHEPTWEEFEQGDTEVIQFRTQALRDSQYWKQGETIDEYNPLGHEWGDA